MKGFYKEHFVRFDRQIVLVDCLQPLNSGPQAFNDMRLAVIIKSSSQHSNIAVFIGLRQT
ncbi:YcjX family protein [Salmonella enterica subsp. enterica serovar Enteritidis]|uniref:YcjX family protein n=1 Tax=Salmonella enterica TaxID=28901 RepID=UPI0039EBD3CE